MVRLRTVILAALALAAFAPSLAQGPPPPQLWKRSGGALSPRRAGDSVAIVTTVPDGSSQTAKLDPIGWRFSNPPLANYVGKIVFRHDFSNLGAFSVVPSGGTPAYMTISAETVNYMTGPQGIKVIPSNADGWAVRGFKQTGMSLNLGDETTHVKYRFYIYDGIDKASPAQIRHIYYKLVDGNGKYRTYYIWTPQANPTGFYGWVEGTFVMSEPSVSDDAGAFDFTDVAEIHYGVDADNDAGYDYESEAVVSFDPLVFYKSRNSKGLILLFADGIYTRQWDYAAHLRGLNLTGSVASANPSIVFAVAAERAGQSNRMSVDQLHALAKAGHTFSCYGNTIWTGPDVWFNKDDDEKWGIVLACIDYYRELGLPRPKALNLSGAGGWTQHDERNFRAMFPLVIGSSDYISGTVVQGVSPSNVAHADFVDQSAALSTRAGTVDAGTDVWTLGAAVTWTGAHPVKFSNEGGALPTSDPQIAADTIYWYRVVNSTTGTIHPTATDAANNTNAIDFSDTGTGTHSVTGITSAAFGSRVKAFVRSKGLWVEGAHVSTDLDLIHGKFILDAFASMVNAGEAQFVSVDELISGTGIISAPTP